MNISSKDIAGSELNQMLSVVKKYYELGMNQEQIAKEEFISKSSVCRLLKKAVKNGYVQFQINYPLESVQTLENEFYEYFDLDKVFIASTYTDDEEIRLKDTCKAVIAELGKIVKPSDSLCVTWGSTLEYLASMLSKETSSTKKCEKVILMNGSTAGDISSMKSSSIVEQFAKWFSAEGYLMPVPLIVDSKQVADILKQDSHVKYVMDFALQSQLAVMSIGAVDPQSVLRQRGAYSKEEFNEVLADGAVGNVSGRCFNIHGNQIAPQIEERLLGPTLDEIKSKKIRIGIAAGNHKAQAIIGALNGKIINRLYTDEITAQEVIKILKRTKQRKKV